jgi:hypothetical protein
MGGGGIIADEQLGTDVVVEVRVLACAPNSGVYIGESRS